MATPKKKAAPQQTVTVNSGSQYGLSTGIAAPLPVSQILQINGLPSNYGNVDWSKIFIGGPDGTGATSGKVIWQSIVNISKVNPMVAKIITSKLGVSTQKAPTGAESANLLASFLAANGQWNAVTSVAEASTKAALAFDAGQMAGITSATASQEANAIDMLNTTIDNWFPGNSASDMSVKKFLGDVVSKLVTLNGDHLVNHNALMDIIRGNRPSGLGAKVDAQIKADYNRAFPGLSQYNSDDTQVHMSEAQYQTYTANIMNSATQFGAPMPTAKQIGELLNGHVSASEYQQRVVDVYAAIQNSDQNVKNTLASQYGITEPKLMNYIVTGNLPQMQRQVAGAEIQDYAQRVGLTGVDQAGYNQLADMAKLASTAGNQTLGYGVSQIENALLSATRDVQLTNALPGSNRPTINTTQLIGSQLAGFGGTTQAAEQVQVGRAEQAAAAPFVKGGGYAETAKGVTGAGSART
jgi:hypothetical protein